jgi:hypothetical protein
VSALTHLWQIDTSAYDYSDYDTESEMSVVRRSGGYLPMRRKVYNLEVANTHTYFVTRWGLWVHNTSGASLPLNPAANLISVGLSVLARIGWGERSEPQRHQSNNHAEMLGFASSPQPIRAVGRFQ